VPIGPATWFYNTTGRKKKNRITDVSYGGQFVYKPGRLSEGNYLDIIKESISIFSNMDLGEKPKSLKSDYWFKM
jgi:hypothetical protein